MDAQKAVAEAWASIDGKLNSFNAVGDPNGHYDGYMYEAGELLRRVEARGWKLVPAENTNVVVE